MQLVFKMWTDCTSLIAPSLKKSTSGFTIYGGPFYVLAPNFYYFQLRGLTKPVTRWLSEHPRFSWASHDVLVYRGTCFGCNFLFAASTLEVAANMSSFVLNINVSIRNGGEIGRTSSTHDMRIRTQLCWEKVKGKYRYKL
jgi:hypothetical protein